MTSAASHEPFIQALRAGNLQAAGEWLVRSFATEVFGLCSAIVRDRASAEDLSQEVFAKAFAGLDGYRGDASARTWLLAITRNRCIDHLRAQKRWSALDDESDPDELPEEISLPHSVLSRRTEIDRALSELSEIERGLIVLRFRHGLAYEELAQVFGLRTATTRMRVSRALAKMRDALEQPPARLQRSMSKESAPMPRPAAAAPAAAAPPPAAMARPAPGAMPSGKAPPAAMPGRASLAPPGAQPERHALHAYFQSAEPGVSVDLRERLRAMASSLSATHP